MKRLFPLMLVLGLAACGDKPAETPAATEPAPVAAEPAATPAPEAPAALGLSAARSGSPRSRRGARQWQIPCSTDAPATVASPNGRSRMAKQIEITSALYDAAEVDAFAEEVLDRQVLTFYERFGFGEGGGMSLVL